MSRAKKIGLVVLSIIALLFFADEYPALRFRGDAKFSGGPVLGYRIQMRPIPFYRPGQYQFHLRGMPNEEMSLQLYAEGKNDSNRDELTSVETTLTALLVDQDGRIVCQASAMPGDGENDHIWVLMSGLEAAYWHSNCLRMPLHPAASYTLTLGISNVDPKTPKINLIPVLEGGQPDLP